MNKALLLAVCLAAAGSSLADPKADYLLYCRGCHLANGESVPPEVPSLVNTLAPFLKSSAGREYIVRVPGIAQTPMSDERVAAVLNWVMANFNADVLPDNYQPYTADEVGAARTKVLNDPMRAREAFLTP